jgi:hypothetical protein
LQRLGAILPDETLRSETRQFTGLNLNLLCAAAIIGLAYLGLGRLPAIPVYLRAAMFLVDRSSLWLLVPLVPLILLPLAMTMALLWKTKEVILDSVFGPKPPVN